MRFYLDNDVSALCRGVLESLDHEVWTASQAGRADVEDDEQTVYACGKDAVLLTHDKAWTERQKRNTTHRHVRLVCQEPDGPGLLTQHLAGLLLQLEHREYVVVELRPKSIRTFQGWQ